MVGSAGVGSAGANRSGRQINLGRVGSESHPDFDPNYIPADILARGMQTVGWGFLGTLWNGTVTVASTLYNGVAKLPIDQKVKYGLAALAIVGGVVCSVGTAGVATAGCAVGAIAAFGALGIDLGNAAYDANKKADNLETELRTRGAMSCYDATVCISGYMALSACGGDPIEPCP